tara:strand:- start:3861 stop:4724 length:864 start_codon:yes stop_codon:yes gene_type:complete
LSRNRDRLKGGAQGADTAPPPQVLQEGAENNGFSFVVPTEFVELPSGGKFYPEGHPLHDQGSIEIKQMTAKEEDMLTSRTLLKKGVALDRVIRNIIVDRRIDIDSLLIGDKNAIIVATRVSGYGNDYTTNTTCPVCMSTEKYSFDLNDANIYEGDNYEDLGVVTNGDGTFNLLLPKTEVDVTFKLLTGKDEKYLAKGIEIDRKSKKGEKSITRQLTHIIQAVNEDTSAEAIKYFINNAPAMDTRHLRLAYQAVSPNLDLTQPFECSECGHEQEMEVPLTADFFWPDR